MTRLRHPSLLACAALGWTVTAGATEYVHYESPQTHPLRDTPDGQRLLAVNTAASRLSVFRLLNQDLPLLEQEIRVGIEPVSVAARDDDEVWVVNHVSDSVSIVSLAQGRVVATLDAGDEPCDVVFAGSPIRAFVSASRDNALRVFDPATRTLLATITLDGLNPRALATSADGASVYVAFAMSGNRTTTVPATAAPAPPPPSNPTLPAAPQVGLIVDAADPAWTATIPYTVLDHDVAEVDVATLTVGRYFDRAGTVHLGLAVHPITGDVFTANTEALNTVRFEPALRGHMVDHRVTRITTGATPTVTAIDLNPGIDYTVLPNPLARITALAQPTDLAFHPTGAHFYVAAFGSDRVARVSAAGAVQARIEIGDSAFGIADPRHMRGPRGLVLHAATDRLYVQNRISNTLSVVDLVGDAVIAEFPIGSHDPTPLNVREGRGFLYDARLSGNGTASCAVCHIDGEDDKLAWDLGDPTGTMQTVFDPLSGQPFVLHPMKGPMVTQSMAGLRGFEPFHWRGDRADLAAFNPAFDALLGGSEISPSDMALFTAFVDSIDLEANPNLELDRSLPATLQGSDPQQGMIDFQTPGFGQQAPAVSCSICHSLPGQFQAIIRPQGPGKSPMDVPFFRGYYRKAMFRGNALAQNIIGFGLEHDGAVSPADPPGPAVGNLTAFFLAFDSGTAPMVGYHRTVDASDALSFPVAGDLATLETRAGLGDGDLVAFGPLDGAIRGYAFDPATGLYRQDRAGAPALARGALLSKVVAQHGSLSFAGGPDGTDERVGIDRDQDGVLDGDEFGPAATTFGTGCPSSAGVIPKLTAHGVPTPGSAVSLELADATALQPLLLLAGLGSFSAPLGGTCTLDILPLVPGFALVLTVPPSGGFEIGAQLPPDTPTGIDLTLQVLVADGGSAIGLAATNAVRLRIE